MDADKVTELPWETRQAHEIVNLEGGKKEILLALAVIVVPNVILTALPGIPDPIAKESSAFLINFSATRLLIIVSWTSTLTLLLSSKYRGWEKRERINSIANGLITWLVIVSVVGYLSIFTYTWLHATTSTIQLLQALPSPSSVSAYGRGFYSSECVNITSYTLCSIGISEKGPVFIQGSEAFRTTANVSSQNTVISFPYRGQSYSLITDPNCFFITQQCGLNWGNGPLGPFNCSSGFSGGLPNHKYYVNQFNVTGYSLNPSWGFAGVEFFQDPGLTLNFSNVVGSGSSPGVQSIFLYTPANPVYLGAYGLILGLTENDSLANLTSGDLAVTATDGLGFIMGCNLTAVSVQQMVQSNISVLRTLASPFVTELANLINLSQAAAGEATKDEFRESWTTGFSTMVLSLSASTISPRITIREQARISTLVARVPKAPLAVLILLTLLYATIGIILACIALQSRPDITKNIQGRLSVAGRAAKCFESNERCEGPTKEIKDLGWKYDLIRQEDREISATITTRGDKNLEPDVETGPIS
ncbi:hypothetical protein V8E51_010107 [Hyaloscypha variabilis]